MTGSSSFWNVPVTLFNRIYFTYSWTVSSFRLETFVFLNVISTEGFKAVGVFNASGLHFHKKIICWRSFQNLLTNLVITIKLTLLSWVKLVLEASQHQGNFTIFNINCCFKKKVWVKTIKFLILLSKPAFQNFIFENKTEVPATN